MELYVKPEFFSQIVKILPANHLDYMDKNNKDLYTEIKRHVNEDITSKFKEIRYIPLSGGTLDYQEDRWDFSKYTVVSNSHAALSFKEVSPVFKDVIKDYVLINILSGDTKISSIYNEFVKLRVFVNYLAKTGLYSVEGIDDSDIEKFFSSLEISERTILSYQFIVKKFLTYYDAEHGTEVLTPGIQELCKRMDYKKIKSIIVANRRQAIPDDYFN